MAPSWSSRPPAMRAIIAYKFLKAPVFLALALVLALAPSRADALARWMLAEVATWGVLARQLARWLELHLTSTVEAQAAVIGLLDGLLTAVEGALLYAGHAWGEWLVVLGLTALLPFEARALWEHPTVARGAVLLLNALVVAYLSWRRLRARRH